MDEYNDKVASSVRKSLRKSKPLEFVTWGSTNLIEFLESIGRDTTNKISEFDVTLIVTNYIRDQRLSEETLLNNKKNNKKKRTKLVTCDEKLRLLFGIKKINRVKVADLIAKHYVENREESDDDDYFIEKRQKLFSLDKIDKPTTKPVVVVKKKIKGSCFAAIVSDNVKLLYLRKSSVDVLAKDSETFESKVIGAFVKIKKPSHQLVHVTGVKEGNLLDGKFLQVTNYTYYLEDVPFSALSDDDFSKEECEELNQRIKNGFAKRLTVVEMEEKVKSLHEDVTKHWLARELVVLQRRISQATEKGWKRELSQYLDRRELLKKPEEQERLLNEVPEVIAEEPELESVDDDDNDETIENDVVAPNPEVYSIDEPDDEKIENDFIAPNPEAFIETHPTDEEQKVTDHQL